jgi:hypothetical protein
MLLPRLLTSCRNSSNHFSTLPTTSHLLSTFLNVLHLCAHLLDSPQLSFHLSLLFSNPFNSCCVTSPQFHLFNFFLSPVEVTQTFFFSPVELPFHSTDPFDSLKLRSAYFKIPLPSGQLSVFDCLISLCDTITVSTFACLIILGSCATVTRESNVQARLSRSNLFDAREAV